MRMRSVVMLVVAVAAVTVASGRAARAQAQCTGAPDGTACDDSDACAQTDPCQAGVCTGGNPVTCTAADQCHTVGTCDPATGICSNPNAADGTACDDSDACTQTDTCQAGVCTGSNPVTYTASEHVRTPGTSDPPTPTSP